MKQNIYQQARRLKKVEDRLTQADAAELLNVDETTLRRYETGKSTPPEDIVKTMMILYDAPWLMWKHLENIDTTNTMPELLDRNLESAMLYYQKESRDVDRVWQEAIDVCHDGEISSDEVVTAKRIIKELDEELSANVALKFALLKKVEEAERKKRGEEL